MSPRMKKEKDMGTVTEIVFASAKETPVAASRVDLGKGKEIVASLRFSMRHARYRWRVRLSYFQWLVPWV